VVRSSRINVTIKANDRRLVFAAWRARVEFVYSFGQVPRGTGRQVVHWLKISEVAQ
jgi:hypothetical protein